MAALQTIQVVIADGHAFIRDGLKQLLGAQPDINVVGDASCGDETIRLVQTVGPDVVVAGLAIPPLNGIELTRQILLSRAATRVIVYSLYSDAHYAQYCLEAGAQGFLLAESLGSDVVSAVRTVHAGQQYLSSKLLQPAPVD